MQPPLGPGLVARGLSRAFRGRRVVDGVDLAVAPGEVVGLLGPNGAGKTTCFRMVAGLEVPDQGEVWLDGQDLARQPLWRRARAGLGYLAQEPTVFRRLSARANLEVALQARGAPVSQAPDLLARAGLSHLSDQPAGRLSGGERRRLELARALAAAPRVLLLDEPFAGVDPVAVAALQAVILDLARQGLGVLVTDHAVRETLGICDRVVLLDGGRVMAAGAPAQVAALPAVRDRYLGHDFRWEPRRT
ncbi:LPS export ABC transporter ATP-binding protein [Myxococcota bacterium]|nr:LPS export ABC transporter ATP-binding protein [Myxococcota bacterium]